MIVHDDAFMESVAVFALGALPENQAREIANHLASCASCATEYSDLRLAASAVGFGAEIAPNGIDEMSARRLKSRVMTAVVESLSSNGSVARPRVAWLPYGAALAAALVAAISIGSAVSLRNDRANDATRIASLEATARDASARANALATQLGRLDARVARIVAPGSRHFPVASGEVVASGNRIVLALHDLPKLPPGKVYQAWTLASGAKAVAPSITFRPDTGGVALVELPEGAAHLAAVAVSVEPTGGSKAPTSKPEFVRALS